MKQTKKAELRTSRTSAAGHIGKEPGVGGDGSVRQRGSRKNPPLHQLALCI